MLSIVCSLFICASQPLYADQKVTHWTWSYRHWQQQNHQPYIQDPKHTHLRQWDDQKWQPADWAMQRGGMMNVVKGFYANGILSDRDKSDGFDLIEVGPNFYNLSGYDQQRVMQTVDAAYQITAKSPDAFVYLTDWRSSRVVGVYSAQGLQLQ